MKIFKRKKAVVLVCLTFLFVSIFELSSNATIYNKEDITLPTQIGDIIYVGGSGPNNYSKIQDALDVANSGDTIFVYSGVYQEELIVNTSVYLQAEDMMTTIIEGNQSFRLIDIYADDVILDGFTLMDSSYASYNTAVHIEGNNTSIVNNRIIDIGSGVFIAGSDNNNIANNEFEKSGVVISTMGDNTNTVSGNTVNSMPLEFHENVADLVIDYPVGQIILVDCVNVTMQDLVISETSIGIQMKDCVDCCISNCDINSCFDGNILLSYSEDCIVRHNDIHSSYEEGIYLINTRNVTLELNNFYLNRMAILSEYTTLNRYVNNNFANNGFCVFSVIGTLNTWDHNYWNRARIFPKFIFEFPRIVLDRNPAKTPN